MNYEQKLVNNCVSVGLKFLIQEIIRFIYFSLSFFKGKQRWDVPVLLVPPEKGYTLKGQEFTPQEQTLPFHKQIPVNNGDESIWTCIASLASVSFPIKIENKACSQSTCDGHRHKCLLSVQVSDKKWIKLSEMILKKKTFMISFQMIEKGVIIQ